MKQPFYPAIIASEAKPLSGSQIKWPCDRAESIADLKHGEEVRTIERRTGEEPPLIVVGGARNRVDLQELVRAHLVESLDAGAVFTGHKLGLAIQVRVVDGGKYVGPCWGRLGGFSCSIRWDAAVAAIETSGPSAHVGSAARSSVGTLW
ncbi:MAG TPA: hypothetical protein VKR31_12765 [Rhizomicrobium sp.]|nr:hypothetical protein [Rhizomicrobium sp.]